MRPLKKTVFTLRVDDYHPEICDVSHPLIKYWAKKIGADFHVITERRFPGWPAVYEKLQIHDLGREMGNDWNIYVDSDALIHPDMFDPTNHLSKDTVAHNGKDMAGIRWSYDEYFLRDGRHIGSANWFAVASDWCLDLWRPLDLSLSEAVERIHLTVEEVNAGIEKSHLIDDYTLSRNIARHGLKHTTITEMSKALGFGDGGYFWHQYLIPPELRVAQMNKVLRSWRLF